MERVIRGKVLTCWLLVLSISAAKGNTITLSAFVEQVRQKHPFFRGEALSKQVEQKRQEGFLGDKDWNLFAKPTYDNRDLPVRGFGSPDSVEAAQFEVGVERHIWKTGGRFKLAYDYEFLDQTIQGATLSFPGTNLINLAGPDEFFQNSVSVSYIQPILKNRGGNLDRLDYDLQGYTIKQADLQARENQEAFLLSLSTRFLNWVLLTEELKIAQRRRQLAEEELGQTQRKYNANMVEEVDVFRAKDAVIEATQGVKKTESSWEAVRADLAVQSCMPDLSTRNPEFDLYRRESLPDADKATDVLLRESRAIALLQARYEQLERERDGLLDLRKADLDLAVSGSLTDGAADSDNAIGFDKPGATVALAYRYPLRNRAALAGVERATLELLQTNERLADLRLTLESGVRSLLAQIAALNPVLDLSNEQIQTAAHKTQGEVKLYEQGRNQLTFVIQSRDNEARAQLSHARNGAHYHELILQYRALMDELLSQESRSSTIEGEQQR